MIQAAVGRGHLVLRADRLPEQLLLDVNPLHGQLVLADHAPFQGMQRMQQPHGEGRAGAHAAAGGQVAVVMDFHAPGNLQELQRFADRGVRNLVDGLAILDLRIHHADAVLEERRQIAASQITVLVDRRGDDRAAMVAIPAGVIRPPPRETKYEKVCG